MGTGLASVVTWSLDRAASDRLESARQQVTMVRKQRDDSAAQCGLLDKKLEDLRGSVERWPGEHSPTSDRRLGAAQNENERPGAPASATLPQTQKVQNAAGQRGFPVSVG